MADILFSDTFRDGSRYFSKRFICQCHDPAHSFDITVGQEFRSNVTWDFSFSGKYLSDKWDIWGRVRKSVKMILGKEVFDHEFYLREEDIEDLEEMVFVAKEWRDRDNEQRDGFGNVSGATKIIE